MTKKRIHQGMRYMVECKAPVGRAGWEWKEIYSAHSKKQAAELGSKWTSSTGQETRIVIGPDHPDVRYQFQGARPPHRVVG